MDGLDEVMPVPKFSSKVTSIVDERKTRSAGPKSSALLGNATLGTTDIWCCLFCYLGQADVFTITRPGTTNIKMTTRKILQSLLRQSLEKVKLEIILFKITNEICINLFLLCLQQLPLVIFRLPSTMQQYQYRLR
jgi:hypothetical protein